MDEGVLRSPSETLCGSRIGMTRIPRSRNTPEIGFKRGRVPIFPPGPATGPVLRFSEDIGLKNVTPAAFWAPFPCSNLNGSCLAD